jgi:hypothetical protein
VDPDEEYARFGLRCSTLADLWTRARGPASSLVFVPSDDRALGTKQFSTLCFYAWRLAKAGRLVTFVVDELGEFTRANEAPAAWRRLVKRGRKHGVTIYAGAQRPAEIDKTIWSNPSLVRSGRLGYADDQTVIAAALAVKVADVATLGQLDYLERDFNAGTPPVRGHLTF